MPNHYADLLWFIEKGCVSASPSEPEVKKPSQPAPDISEVIEARHRARAAGEIHAPWQDLP